MSTHRSPLTSVVEVFAAMRPSTEEARQEIAALLGLGWRPREAVTAPAPDADLPVAGVTSQSAMASPRAAKAAHPRKSSRVMLEPAAHLPAAAPSLARQPPGIVPLAPTHASAHTPALLHEPLFDARWFRSLALTLFATEAFTDELDWPLIERHVLSNRVLSRIPWRTRRVPGHGLTVFADRSLAMQPFWRDQIELVRALQRLFGRAQVSCAFFEVDPWTSEGARIRWPAGARSGAGPHETCLFLSDFGLIERAVQGNSDFTPWRELLSKVARPPRQRVALIPVPAADWPPMLRSMIPRAVPWDRTTTTELARRILR